MRKNRQANAPEDEPDDSLDWTEQLLSTLKAMKTDTIERLCQRVLRESGFVKVEGTGRSGDGGIDGYGVLRVNLVSFQVIFQAKRWKDSIGSSVLRDFRGAMIGRADKGLIVTTGTFTAEARKESTRDGAPTIDLVDGETLCRLLRDLKLGVTVRLVEEVDIEPAFFEAVSCVKMRHAITHIFYASFRRRFTSNAAQITLSR